MSLHIVKVTLTFFDAIYLCLKGSQRNLTENYSHHFIKPQ